MPDTRLHMLRSSLFWGCALPSRLRLKLDSLVERGKGSWLLRRMMGGERRLVDMAAGCMPRRAVPGALLAAGMP
jgi:hypothetical protein